MRWRPLGFLLIGAVTAARADCDPASPAEAAEIMARVAANMASGVDARQA